ncbi:MAG: hypothetical protein NC300_04895, partial [Bacteroidales bacterium]|nr:hypothetical protein [Clostridium sp.]MCM1203459.1 hypothetical protein [Bacteroidales bacterium]
LAIELGVRKRARQEGLAEGHIEGHTEACIEIAKNLLDVLDIPTIAQKTGLSEEEVKKLSENA